MRRDGLTNFRLGRDDWEGLQKCIKPNQTWAFNLIKSRNLARGGGIHKNKNKVSDIKLIKKWVGVCNVKEA